MKADREIQHQVTAALEREPELDAAKIGVSVTDCVVTLLGTVTRLRQKWLAERAVRNLPFVRAIANDLEVQQNDRGSRSDSAIAAAVAMAIDQDRAIPDDAVQATVRYGWVTLTGNVTWPYQKNAAAHAVERIGGVKGVANSILVKPHRRRGPLVAERRP